MGKSAQQVNENQLKTLKDKVSNLEKRLIELESKNKTLEDKVTTLESENTISKHVTTKLSNELDRLDQYHRRSNVVISNVLKLESENNEDVKAKVHEIIKNELDLPSAVADIDKLHRIGKVRETNGKKTQDIIIRFRSHRTRYEVYEKRKSSRNIKIKPNLTKKRQTLKYEASQLTENNSMINFVYADIHGDIKVRLNNIFRGKYAHNFNSIEELEELLDKINIV